MASRGGLGRLVKGLVLYVGLPLIVVVAGGLFALIRTQPGIDWLLRQAVASVSSSLGGRLQVGGIHTDGLFRGITLHDVRIVDEGDRPFVTADSIRVGYALSDLLRREIVLVPTEIWRPAVVIERLHGDDRSNVARIFAPDPQSTAPSLDSLAGTADDPGLDSPGWTMELRRTRLGGGSFVLRQPIEPESSGDGWVVEHLEGRGAGAYRVIRLEDIDVRLSSADIVGGLPEGMRFAVEELSLAAHIRPEPFRVDDLRGDVLVGGGGVEVDLERLALPASELMGSVRVGWGGEGFDFALDLDAPTVDLTDFRWLIDRIPAASGALALQATGTADASSWTAEGVDLSLGRSRVRGRAGIELGSGLRLVDTSLELAPLRLADLSEWLDGSPELPGELRGRTDLSGALRDLRVDADLSFSDPAVDVPSSTASVRGWVDVDGGFAARDLSVRIDTLQYASLAAFAPDFPVRGSGAVAVDATGTIEGGMQISGDVTHRVAEGLPSRVSYSGVVQRIGDEMNLNLALTLSPLSLDGLAAGLDATWPVVGDLSGSLLARGPVSDVELSGAFTTPGGPVDASAALDLGDPLRSYRIEASVSDFALHEVTSAADPTVVTADLSLDARGGTLETLEGTGALVVRPSRYGSAEIDSATARFRARGGRLIVEDLAVHAPFLALTGSGDLALRDDEPDGLLSLTWTIDSMASLRPIIFGEEGIAADTLTSLEREILVLDGIDPDTLTNSNVVPLEGSAVGEITLRGAVNDFEGTGFVEIQGGEYASYAARRGRIDATGAWSGDGRWRASAVAGLDSLSLAGFRLATGTASGGWASDGVGDFDVALESPEGVGYSAAGTVDADSIRTRIALSTLAVTDSLGGWRLSEGAVVEVGGAALRLEDLTLVGDAGPGGSRSSIRADGVIDRSGRSDLVVEARDVDVRGLATLLQRPGLPEGSLDIDLTLQGPAEAPEFEADLLVEDLVLEGSTLSRLEGSVSYRSETVQGRLVGSRGTQRLLELDGRVPADLSLVAVEERFPDRDMDLGITLDSLPAATVLGILDAFQNVQGSFDGEIRFRGGRESLRPSGGVVLQGGAFTIPGIGLNARSVQGDFRLQEDFGVLVDAQLRSGGTANVRGTVSLEDLLDPGFDLQVSAAGFQAVSRRDLTARVGGDVTLTGSYEAPQVQGAVVVEQGELFLEEFVRGAEVIDLTDPRFFDVVDTTLVASAPGASRNPFLSNLRVDVDLSLNRDFWIRSRGNLQGLDVELGGALTVNFDRPARELVMVGTLQAVRGNYSQFGRQFEVQSGTLEFPGIPGINPSLDIDAEYRLRRREGESLDILANVGGTLLSPEVTLSSDAQPPIPESDLISYLLFGQPPYALTSEDASAILDLAVSTGLGGLGSSVGRSIGVDYLSISQSGSFNRLSAVASPADWSEQFADTQIEMGRYLGEDVFIAITVRPLTGLAGSIRRTQLPGASIEWNLNDYWSIEAFFEDQLLRQTAGGLVDLDATGRNTVGFSLFREWGY